MAQSRILGLLAVHQAVAVAWPAGSPAARVAISILGASFLFVYYFKAIAPLRQAGWVFDDRAVGAFQMGEALAGAAILAAFVAWGRSRSLRLLAGPAVLGIVLAVGYVFVPERFPLISTWALGGTMSLPFPAYAAGVALLGLTILKQLTSGAPQLGLGLLLLFIGHRMLPLTYFNLLVLAGFLLMATALVPVAPHGRDRAPAQP